MTHPIRLAALFAALALGSACGRASPVDDALARDLEQAAGPSIELAPRGEGTAIISAQEGGPRATPAAMPAPSRTVARTPARRPAPAPTRIERAPSPAPHAEVEQVVAAPVEATEVAAPQESAMPAAGRPSTRPAVNPPPPGGYRTVGEVIRNAPFPINP